MTTSFTADPDASLPLPAVCRWLLCDAPNRRGSGTRAGPGPKVTEPARRACSTSIPITVVTSGPAGPPSRVDGGRVAWDLRLWDGASQTDKLAKVIGTEIANPDLRT